VARGRAVDGSLNVDPTKNSFGPSITIIGGVPYVAWYESNGTANQVRVARLGPDILAESAAPSATGATLTATVDDFGVPLPVGFEYGLTSSFGSQTPLQTTPGSGTSTVTQSVGGLAPATGYFYRAFGSDTFGETSRGATQSFGTLVLTLSTLRASPHKVSVAGRKVDGRCVKPTAKNSRHKHCRRPVKLNVSYTARRRRDRHPQVHATSPRAQGGQPLCQADEHERKAQALHAAFRAPRPAHRNRQAGREQLHLQRPHRRH
jgi:hypothetical protein